jgi:hypothetical protein
MDSLLQEYVIQNVLESRLRNVPEYNGVRTRDRALPNLGEECLTASDVSSVYDMFRKPEVVAK